MSTRLNNGYQLPSVMHLPELLAWVAQVRDKMTAQAAACLEDRAVRRAIALFDEDTARRHGREIEGHATPIGRCLYRALSSIRDEVLEARKTQRRCHLEPETTLSVIPDGDRLFGLLYSEQEDLPSCFSSQPGVSRYGYWNSTDGPSGITQEQWSERGSHWDRLLGPTGIASNVSASFTLVSPHLIHMLKGPEMTDSLDVLSSPEALRRRAHQLALHTPAAALPPDLQEEFSRTNGLGVWVRHEMDLAEGRVPGFNAERDTIMEWLIPAPTVAQLRADLEES